MKNFSIIYVGLLSLIACKKTETPAPTNPTGSSSTTTTTGNYAVFSSRAGALLTSGSLLNVSNVSSAYCSNSILVNDNPYSGTIINMGDVSMNGVVFQKDNFSTHFLYTDSTFSTFTTPHQWIITGSTSVPSFSYTNATAYPTYTGYAAIADSFVIFNTINIPLNNYSGTDIVETYFTATSPTFTSTSIQTYTNNPTSISFTTADLSAIGVNNNVSLIINFYKNNVQVINGKNYNFRTGYGFTKNNMKFK